MKITVLGSGMVGQILSTRLMELGYKVTMGTRDPEKTKNRNEPNQLTGISFHDWYSENSQVHLAPFENAMEDTDFIINATSGMASIDVLESGGNNLKGKVILDLANPLDFSEGFPPSLSICNTNSLGERIQAQFSDADVVKCFNTMNAYLMVKPQNLPGKHNVFICGNSESAKSKVSDLLTEIGWDRESIIDLGDITTARATEMLFPLWARLYQKYGDADFNFYIQRTVA